MPIGKIAVVAGTVTGKEKNIMMKKMDTGSVVWGIAFIIAAVLLVCVELDLLPYGNIMNLLITLLCAAFAVRGLMDLNFYYLFYSIGIIVLVWKDELGIGKLGTVTVIIAATFLAIGFSKLFPHMDKRDAVLQGKAMDPREASLRKTGYRPGENKGSGDSK